MLNEKTISVNPEMQTFEKVHLKLKRPIREYLFHLTGSTYDSEDVAQEIFIKLWDNWNKVQMMRDNELKKYVFIIIRNHVYNVWKASSRAKRNKKEFLTGYPGNNTGCYLHDDTLIREGLKIHQRAINELTDKERIVYLYHQEDYSAGEIAKMLKLSKFTVNNQLYAACKSVKNYFTQTYGLNLCEPGQKN